MKLVKLWCNNVVLEIVLSKWKHPMLFHGVFFGEIKEERDLML